jgi:hypothetical protein
MPNDEIPLCFECNAPMRMVHEHGVDFLVCEACGSVDVPLDDIRSAVAKEQEKK